MIQVDSEGYHSQLLKIISEYSKDESAVQKVDQWIKKSEKTKCIERRQLVGNSLSTGNMDSK